MSRTPWNHRKKDPPDSPRLTSRPALPMTRLSLLVCAAASLALGRAEPPALKFDTAKESRDAYEKVIAPFLAKHCEACHKGDKAEGDLEVAKLDPDMKAGTHAGRWTALRDKLVAREMPPAGRPRPADDELRAVTGWIQAELKRANKVAARRAAADNGNALSHGPLFDPKNKDSVPDVPARLRRVSPEIYAAFLAEHAKNVPGVSNPFSPEGKTLFKDTGAPRIDEPVTSLLIRNAVAIVERAKGREIDELVNESKPATDAAIAAAVQWQFGRVLGRKASADEVARLTALVKKNIADAGRAKGVRYALAAVYLLPEAVFRWETGAGEPDGRGLVRLAPRAIAYQLAYALGDRRPDATLLAAADAGKLATKEGVAKEVRRLLDDTRLAKPRLLRFFREYFGYAAALEVFKADKDNPEHDARALVEDTDRLVEWVLEKDRDVLKELLTTNKSFVAHKTATALKRKRAEGMKKYEAEKEKSPEKFKNKKPPRVGKSVYESYGLKDFPDAQPAELPKEQRAGILTQPAWLVAFSTSDDNHAILRGKFVRERLLGNVVPDLPITVDAQLPDAPEKTLRERMAITQQAYCWKCHRLMNDVGLPFEMFDPFGRSRAGERVQDAEATRKNVDKKGKPLGPVTREAALDASGLVAHVGDARVEGKVTDAVQMLHRLAASERVEQVFVRHAFRYWMGRNETPGDASTLQAAHKVYKESGGSFKALLAALLGSDSFLYRASPAAAK